ncbi:MAG TPA: hypothetical protein PKV66_02220 [Candidatus Pelethenecus sp.]|nr:hypothetical protein [Candidatus Pelethenecus sp.]
MNRNLKIFIISTIFIVIIYLFTAYMLGNGLWYGIFPFAIATYLMVKFSIPSWKNYKRDKHNSDNIDIKDSNKKQSQQNKDNIVNANVFKSKMQNDSKIFSQQQIIEFTEEMLVNYYLDLNEEFVNDSGIENFTNIYNNKKDIIEFKIRNLIKEQKELHGTDFLTKDNKETKEINSYIGKHSYAITLFFILGLENSFPNNSFNDVIQGIIDLLNEITNNKLLNVNFSMQDLLLNDYLEQMIKTKIEERQ